MAKKLSRLEQYLIDEYMINNQRSEELFGKAYDELTTDERSMLNKYINDINHPQWKPIIINNIDTNYKISNVGNVINANGDLINKYQQSNDWYYQVYISNIGLQLVHRLVAQAFIPNPDNKPQVNHINGIKTCNWIGNLEWVTAKENAKHAWDNNLVNNNGENQGSSIYTNSQIEEVCKLLEKGNLSNQEIEKITGVKAKTIYEIRNKRKWNFISKKYNIAESHKVNLYTSQQIEAVCKLLENPYISHKQISDKTGVSINCIKDIMKKTSYREISDKFNICKRIKSADHCYLAKYTSQQIEAVCKLLENPYMSIKDISAKTGVKLGTVYDVMYGHKWKTISCNYNIAQRQKQTK